MHCEEQYMPRALGGHKHILPERSNLSERARVLLTTVAATPLWIRVVFALIN
jgi:hypothetical protein